MKYLRCILIVASVVAIEACTEGKKEGKEADATALLEHNAVYKQGLTLVAGSDCFSCHQIADVGAGPSYQSIANKYNNTPLQVKQLAQKIIKGGSGVWGAALMPPHPQLSNADAEAMVNYLMLLKK